MNQVNWMSTNCYEYMYRCAHRQGTVNWISVKWIPVGNQVNWNLSGRSRWIEISVNWNECRWTRWTEISVNWWVSVQVNWNLSELKWVRWTRWTEISVNWNEYRRTRWIEISVNWELSEFKSRFNILWKSRWTEIFSKWTDTVTLLNLGNWNWWLGEW